MFSFLLVSVWFGVIFLKLIGYIFKSLLLLFFLMFVESALMSHFPLDICDMLFLFFLNTLAGGFSNVFVYSKYQHLSLSIFYIVYILPFSLITAGTLFFLFIRFYLNLRFGIHQLFEMDTYINFY